MIDFENPLDNDYEDFFKRYYDLSGSSDKMTELQEK